MGYKELLSLALTVSLLANAVAAYELVIVLKRNNSLIDQIESLQREVENLRSQVEYYRSQAEYYSSLIGRLETNVSLIGEAEVNIVAVKTVSESFFTVRYEGLVLKCTVELHAGSGRILVNTMPRIGIDLQTSAQTAVNVAERLTEKSLSNTDVIITVESKEEVYVVDGPSAGAAITIAVIAAIKGERLSNRVFITGTIMPDGSIGRVGGIAEKVEAAAAEGGIIFLVPKGQSTITIYKRVERHVPPFTFITLEPIQLSLEEYLSQKGYDMKVYEVSNVIEAYKYFMLGS